MATEVPGAITSDPVKSPLMYHVPSVQVALREEYAGEVGGPAGHEQSAPCMPLGHVGHCATTQLAPESQTLSSALEHSVLLPQTLPTGLAAITLHFAEVPLHVALV